MYLQNEEHKNKIKEGDAQGLIEVPLISYEDNKYFQYISCATNIVKTKAYITVEDISMLTGLSTKGAQKCRDDFLNKEGKAFGQRTKVRLDRFLVYYKCSKLLNMYKNWWHVDLMNHN